MQPEELLAWLTLLRAPGVGAGGVRALLREAGSARAACANIRRFRPPVGPGQFVLEQAALDWIERPDRALLNADLAWLVEPGHRLLRCDEPDFPPQLENIAAPPVALFVAGDPAVLLMPQVAIVGARSASAQGLATARDFARTFSRAGLVVTSGMADGIDGAAHAGALEAGGATVAVVGTGPDLVYPRKHRGLAANIIQHGAIVSEYPPGTEARPHHFPRRNRLIAGLALGTLVVEAGLQSGSLITARLAAEAGREVFALPGSIHNPLAKGCHRLIRDGARLVETAGEVIEALAPAAQALGADLKARLEAAEAPVTLASGTPDRAQDPDYKVLLAALGDAPAALDELVERTGLGAAAVSSMLLLLELEGSVAPAGNGRWQRLFASGA
ncbi:MAG: DNA-processing protein DprA [Rhodanobacteraceae bacterium]|jgi:DNA processing protein|nr:MAG: DNA-processing protein DprA [Rhodanobacteraceae bacterium]